MCSTYRDERLLWSRSARSPLEDFVQVSGTTDPVLLAVVHHIRLTDTRRRWRLVPEVDPIDRLIDFPLDVAWIDALDDHSLTLRPATGVRSGPPIAAERIEADACGEGLARRSQPPGGCKLDVRRQIWAPRRSYEPVVIALVVIALRTHDVPAGRPARSSARACCHCFRRSPRITLRGSRDEGDWTSDRHQHRCRNRVFERSGF